MKESESLKGVEAPSSDSLKLLNIIRNLEEKPEVKAIRSLSFDDMSLPLELQREKYKKALEKAKREFHSCLIAVSEKNPQTIDEAFRILLDLIENKTESAKIYTKNLLSDYIIKYGDTLSDETINRIRKLDNKNSCQNGITKEDEELARKLAPYFKSEEEAHNFPKRIKGMNNKQIVLLVNQLWDKGVITMNTKKVDLWCQLHEFRLYTASISSWNNMVNKPKK